MYHKLIILIYEISNYLRKTNNFSLAAKRLKYNKRSIMKFEIELGILVITSFS